MDCKILSQAYQEIARETSLPKLLLKALNILRDNTEAQWGCILLESEDEWLIEAISAVNDELLSVLQSNSLSFCLPKSIIDNVANHQKVILLNDALNEVEFNQDPYIQAQQPRAILCAPLGDRGKLEAIVYLENNCGSRVFTPKHLENLQLLSAPIAIATANIRLQQKLWGDRQRIHQFLEVLPVGVEVLDGKEQLYYTNQRAKELRATGIVAEVATNRPVETETNDPTQNANVSLAVLTQEQDTKIDEPDKKITLVESWSNSIANERGETVYVINAFQDITEHKKAEQLLAEYNRTLELQVTERTLELSQALENLKTAQNKLIQSEKMVALGQLVAGVAHEINTPLGVIRASSYNNIKALAEFLEQMPQLFPRLSLQEQNLFFAFLEKAFKSEAQISSREKRKLKRDLQAQLQDKGIAKARHIANILTDIGIYQDIVPFLPLLQSPDVDLILQLAYNLARLHGNSNNSIIAIERASKVVFALKNYARYDPTGEKQQVDITEGIETVLELYHNQLKQGIEVIRDYPSLPLIFCYPDELIQVWTNLIHNAIQAMRGKGKLEISMEQQNEQIIVKITDSGCGIPEDIKDKIFQPFFTTKPMGEGSGLGLDIARKIIDKHQGDIEVESVPGCTTFQVKLPIKL
ncbi:MAG: ATP-binding protein [Xenococcaceae cyanobacterium MO_188.B32]|nr:ATP-binding protein [Xenococcaceae cyanobacterium MO_188.B32]